MRSLVWFLLTSMIHAGSCVNGPSLPIKRTTVSSEDVATLDKPVSLLPKQGTTPVQTTAEGKKDEAMSSTLFFVPSETDTSTPTESPQTILRGNVETFPDALPVLTNNGLTTDDSIHSKTPRNEYLLAFAETIPVLEKEVPTPSIPLQAAQKSQTNVSRFVETFPRTRKDVTVAADLFQITRMHNKGVSVFGDSLPETEANEGKLAELFRTTQRPNKEMTAQVPTKPAARLADPMLRAKTKWNTSADSSKLTAVRHKPPGNVKCDLSCCNCNGNKALCTGTGRYLPYLPRLPAHINHFRMVNADLIHLTRHKLSNLSNFDISVMNLTFNSITRLEADTFADFHKLKLLDLSGNYIPATNLQLGLKSINGVNMQTLALEKMDLTGLPDNVFDMFANMSLKKISLRQNHLQTFNGAVFAKFARVDFVDLTLNAISLVNISTEVHIRKLVLKENALWNFPDLCLHRSGMTGQWGYFKAFSNLQSLYISGNNFQTIPSGVLRGACLPNLVKLDISSSPKLHTLHSNFIADLPKLNHLIVNHMTHLKFYERLAFNSSSLKRLSLRQNKRIKSSKVDFAHMFRYCPNLEKLWIVNTGLAISEEEMWSMLVPLQSLKTLSLEKIGRGFIPADLLWRLPNLETLIMTANSIQSPMLERALKNVSTLRYLNLQGNNIRVVTESTLPWECRRNLRYLDLSSNPYSCTCDLRWFKRWLEDVSQNRSVKVHYYPSEHKYVCHTPSSMRNIPIKDFHPTEESCAEKNYYLAVGMALGGLLVLIVVTAVFIYRFRWDLRFWVYRFRRRRQAGETPEQTHFEFDIYVACSVNDLPWVFDELVPLLEDDQGLKLFLQDRDAIPGTVMADNITRYIDESERVLLLISDNYLRESWRQFEFQHIVYAAVDQQKDVIVLLLGQVEVGWMTKTMRRMLTHGTFLQWSSSEEAQRVFHEGLMVALRTADVNLQTVC